MKKPAWTQTHETRFHALQTKQTLSQRLEESEITELESLRVFRNQCLPMSPEELQLVEESNAKTLKLIQSLRALIAGAGP